MVVDPWGTVVAQAPDVVGIVRADLDLDRVAALRRQIPALSNRRPEVYEDRPAVDTAAAPDPAFQGEPKPAPEPASSRT